MLEGVKAEEVGILVRARQLLREKGLSPDTSISGICEAAGISRKTGYEWAEKALFGSEVRQRELEAELARLQFQHEQLKADFDQVKFENEGRKLAWEIHEVDQWVSSKKNTTVRKGKERQ